MTDTAIHVEKLSRHFGRIEALSEVDLSVAPGTIYGLLGHNGAGKTTLIRTLLGLLPASAGRVTVLGCDPMREPVALKRRLGYVPEDLSVYPWMTVDEIVRFCAGLYPSWDDRRIEHLIERFELPRRRRIATLSRGMRATRPSE